MTQYAYFDSTIATASPVLGWFDTDLLKYPSLPASSDLLTLTADQWADRLSGYWVVTAGALVAGTQPAAAPVLGSLSMQAQRALDASDRVVLRCYEHAVAVPAEWATYRTALRAIVSGASTATALPAAPSYPSGT